MVLASCATRIESMLAVPTRALSGTSNMRFEWDTSPGTFSSEPCYGGLYQPDCVDLDRIDGRSVPRELHFDCHHSAEL